MKKPKITTKASKNIYNICYYLQEETKYLCIKTATCKYYDTHQRYNCKNQYQFTHCKKVLRIKNAKEFPQIL